MIDTPLARQWFMHSAHTAIGVVAEKFRAGQPPLPPARPPEVRTIRVGLVVGPEQAWDLAAARVLEHLRKDPSLECCHAWDCVDLGIDDPTDYDCLLLLGWPSAAAAERLKRVEHFCRNGGSLVALRAMHAELPGWQNFSEEVFGGRQPPGRPSRLLEVERSETAWHHPAIEGVQMLIAEGEVYFGPRFSPDTTVLLTATVDDRPRPVAWARRHRGGRVFCTTLGHDEDFCEAGFLRLIASAVRWAG